jgi:hypothetical protein
MAGIQTLPLDGTRSLQTCPIFCDMSSGFAGFEFVISARFSTDADLELAVSARLSADEVDGGNSDLPLGGAMSSRTGSVR